MVELTSPLDDVDENTLDHGGNNLQSQGTPASTRFRSLFKVLAIITLILSFLTLALIITNYIILGTSALRNSNWWSARYESNQLGKVIIPSLIFAVINVVFNFPILLNVVVDITLAACIIPRIVRLIDVFPDRNWCLWYGYPTPQPDPKCEQWKLVVAVLIGVILGLSLLICVIYLIQLGFRTVAIYRSKIWKKPLSHTFPSGEIILQVKLRVLNQESGGRSVEAGAGSEHGPVYI